MVRVGGATHLFVEPGKLDGVNPLDEIRNSAGDTWRKGVVACQQAQEIGDNTNLARRGDQFEVGNSRILAAETIQHRSLLEERV